MLMIQDIANDGLSLAEVLRDIPHDAGAMVVYVLLLAFVGFIWYGSRQKRGGGSATGVRHEERH